MIILAGLWDSVLKILYFFLCSKTNPMINKNNHKKNNHQIICFKVDYI